MSIRITIPTLSVLLVAVSILVLVQHHDDHDRSLRLRSPHDDGISDTSPNSDVWIVELKPGAAVGVSSLASQITRNGKGHVGFVFQHALQGFVYHGSDIDAIATNALVKSVTRDTISRITASRVRQSTPTGIRRIFAHTKKYMKQANQNCRCDAVVAVLDTGVDFQYPDVEVNTAMSVDCTRGAWGEGNCKQGQGDDDHGHGTHVAGTIAAISNGQGVVGVCPGAEIWSIKVLSGGGWGYNSWILAGIEYVMSHASRIDVVNMSLSGYGCDKMYCAVIGRAKRSGIAFAVAAGNDNQPADLYQPACCQAVMTVSALSDSDGKAGGNGGNTCSGNRDDMIATFSNYGSAVDMIAPGDCILSTVPGGYASYSGTSMASPHVAGALAVLASTRRHSRVNELYRKLKKRGNYDYTDKFGDTSKEPLLDLTKLANAKMVGTCG